VRVPLRHAAHVRSGDKGNTATISVIAYSDALYPILVEQLTADRFKRHYNGVIQGTVTRYELDRLGALHFVAEEALGGGVSRSLNLDAYGKTLAGAILGFELDVPDELAGELRGQLS
jgi:hypothetical protein